MTQTFPDTLVPRKTLLGARLIATPDPTLSSALRRVLLLADGQRNVASLAAMMPERQIQTDLAELVRRSLLETAAGTCTFSSTAPLDAAGHDLPEGWESATNFMVARARANLGVMAVEIVEALEKADGPDQARHAMSQWYRAMRNSREGRLQADVDRIKAAAMLRGQPHT